MSSTEDKEGYMQISPELGSCVSANREASCCST